MGDFRQRVVLIHELRQLRRAEEFLDGGCDGFGVDQILRRQPFGFGQTQAFLDCALDAHQTDTEHVFGHFADAADAAVAEMVNIINLTIAVANVDQYLEYRQNVFHRQHTGRTIFGRYTRNRCATVADSTVEFHPTDIRQIVTLR